MKNYKKIFQEMLKERNFAQLISFHDPSRWETLNSDERELLSLLFVTQGEKQLSEGDAKVLESFRLANSIAPDNAKVLCKQGLIFCNLTQNPFYLKTACKFFETSVAVEPDFFDAWHGWANCLVRLGLSNRSFQTFNDALDKFATAKKLSPAVTELRISAYYRDLGFCWYAFGKLSGEPHDFKKAVQFYQKALRLGMCSSEFWNDYGNALHELAHLAGKTELIAESVEKYWMSIKQSPSYYPGWHNMATSLTILYQSHPQDAYFSLACDSFDRAIKIDANNSTLWKKWGELLAVKGKTQRDVSALWESSKKMEAADLCDTNNPEILNAWGEVLLLIGSWEENYTYLKEALKKITSSLEIQKDFSRGWFLYGSCLNEIGVLFRDERYFIEAAEKFQFALQLDENDPFSWHGLALSSFGRGQILDDTSLIEQAQEYCLKVVECQGSQIPQFWNDWGLILLKLANLTGEKKYLELAVPKFEQALALVAKMGIQAPYQADWLYNLGCAVEALGECEESTALLGRAISYFSQALEMNPDCFHAHFNTGSAYLSMGEITGDLEFFFEANKYFEKMLAHDPEDDSTWNEWGVSFIHIGNLIKDTTNPESGIKYYLEAEKKLLQAAGLGNCIAIYYLACLYSITENFEGSIFFLEKCEKNHTLPEINDLLLDDWLENVRQTPLFFYFISQLETNESE